MEQRGMLSLIWKESFRNSGSRWSAASQARLMLVRRYALSDDNKRLFWFRGGCVNQLPAMRGSKTANTARAALVHCREAQPHHVFEQHQDLPFPAAL